MSMPSPPLRVSFLDHSCSPVDALSANALSAVVAVDLAAGDADAVRTLVGRVQLGVPEQLAALHVDRVHARVQVLVVGDAADDDRVGREVAECAGLAGDRHLPGDLELGDVGRVDRRRHVTGTGQVAVGLRPARGRPRWAAAVVVVDDVVVAWVCARWSTSSSAPACRVEDDDDDDFLELPPQAASSATAATTAPSTPKTFPRVQRREALIGCT